MNAKLTVKRTIEEFGNMYFYDLGLNNKLCAAIRRVQKSGELEQRYAYADQGSQCLLTHFESLGLLARFQFIFHWTSKPWFKCCNCTTFGRNTSVLRRRTAKSSSSWIPGLSMPKNSPGFLQVGLEFFATFFCFCRSLTICIRSKTSRQTIRRVVEDLLYTAFDTSRPRSTADLECKS